jgi:hypothetical protein
MKNPIKKIAEWDPIKRRTVTRECDTRMDPYEVAQKKYEPEPEDPKDIFNSNG